MLKNDDLAALADSIVRYGSRRPTTRVIQIHAVRLGLGQLTQEDLYRVDDAVRSAR